MKKLYVLVGAPGSGKSTWAATHISSMPAPAFYVSRDEVRFSLVSEGDSYFSKEKEVYRKFISLIKDGLQNYDITVADATHLNVASRAKLLRALGTSLQGVEVSAIVIQNSLADTLAQNRNRLKTRSFVSEDRVRVMFNSMTIPSFEEGFDKVYIYNAKNEGAKYTILERE